MSKASNLAKGGMYTALTVLFLYLSNIVPANRLYLLALASCIIPLSIMTTSVYNTFVIYAASVFLSLILGMRQAALAYAIFFGLYGLAKYYIERLKKPIIEFILKYIFFNLSLTVTYLLYKTFFLSYVTIKLPIPWVWLMLQVIFLVYDYALTAFIAYVQKRFISKGII